MSLYRGYFVPGSADPEGTVKLKPTSGKTDVVKKDGSFAMGLFHFTKNFPSCSCDDKKKPKGPHTLSKGSMNRSQDHSIASTVTFQADDVASKDTYTVTCTVPQSIKDKVKKHEDTHETNYGKQVDILNKEHSKSYPSKDECLKADAAWRREWSEWRTKEDKHKHTGSSPTPTYPTFQDAWDDLYTGGSGNCKSVKN